MACLAGLITQDPPFGHARSIRAPATNFKRNELLDLVWALDNVHRAWYTVGSLEFERRN